MNLSLLCCDRQCGSRLIQQLQDWSDNELGVLAEIIQGVLESRREQPEEEIKETRADGSSLVVLGGNLPTLLAQHSALSTI